MNVIAMLSEIRAKAKISQAQLAHLLETSLVSVNRWERGASIPSPAQTERIRHLYRSTINPSTTRLSQASTTSAFSSRGIRQHSQLPLFSALPVTIELSSTTFAPILSRLTNGCFLSANGEQSIVALAKKHSSPSTTTETPPTAGISAGKNTYTYDAHTYHTKVPPQGIAELLLHYLPSGGLVLDPFAGSGMTGVAASVHGYDCVLNELSPAASFIANRFTSFVEPELFVAAVNAVIEETRRVREELYSTQCRECGRSTEILYVVWSYRVLCNSCNEEFLLWDYCRSYGRTVREHKILSEFPCPHCQTILKKSSLRRTFAEPVQIGYKCCGSRQQEVTHPLNQEDLERIHRIEANPPLAEGFYPTTVLPNGVNLRQPVKHGIDRIDKFYTTRNLAAMSHLWKAIHRIEDDQLAAHIAFVFTSLYQRVTRLSEFRFWGGSGNTARFNVPYIFNEANIFVTFLRKARTIQDHLEATAAHYNGEVVVVQNSATSLEYLRDESVDLIFTDPPFGANINYSEMNILWESWLESYTDNQNEAVVNRVQGKGIREYQDLMEQSLNECYRVLRSGHWLLLVFMNSSREVWSALRSAILNAGFSIEQIDVFDKQHGTFKQFVSENTAGCDLVLHCRKPTNSNPVVAQGMGESLRDSVRNFLKSTDSVTPTNVYLHVKRDEEIDYRKLYSEWLAQSLKHSSQLLDFAEFRSIAKNELNKS